MSLESSLALLIIHLFIIEICKSVYIEKSRENVIRKLKSRSFARFKIFKKSSPNILFLSYKYNIIHLPFLSSGRNIPSLPSHENLKRVA